MFSILLFRDDFSVLGCLFDHGGCHCCHWYPSGVSVGTCIDQPSDAQFGTVRVPFVRHRLLHLQVAGPTSSQHLGARWTMATVVVALVNFVLLSDLYEFFFCWFSLLVFHCSCSFVGACLVWPHPTAYLLISRLILGHFQSFFFCINSHWFAAGPVSLSFSVRASLFQPFP